MKYLNSIVAAVITAVASSVAFAQADPRVPVTFRQQVPADSCSPDSICTGGGVVSQSRDALQSQVQYKWTLQNLTTNPLNRVFARLDVLNGDGLDPATIDTVITSLDGSPTPPVCTYSVSRTSVRCELGSIASSGTPTAVAVYFIVNVPKNGTQIFAHWQGGGYEGSPNAHGTGCCQPSGDYITTMVDRTVDQSYKFMVQMFVKKEGTNIFTGDLSIPMPGDLHTTFVGAPKIADTYGDKAAEIEKFLGTINETSSTCPNGVFKSNKCFKSEVTIEKVDFSKLGTISWFSVDKDVADQHQLVQLAGAPDELLDVNLGLDSSAMKPNTKPEAVTVTYTEIVNGVPTTTPKDVLACPVPTSNTTQRPDLPVGTLLVHIDSLPCYTKKFIYPNKTTPAELKNDLGINGKHYKNGGWTVL